MQAVKNSSSLSFARTTSCFFPPLLKWGSRSVSINPDIRTTNVTFRDGLHPYKLMNTFKKIEFVQESIKLGFDRNEVVNSKEKIFPVTKIDSHVKIVVFSPKKASKEVIEEIRKIIGIGSHIFTTPGIARYIPQIGANPSQGTIGRMEEVIEDRIESSVELLNLKTLINSVKRVHPYDEVGFDIYPYIHESFRNNYSWLKNSFISIKETTSCDFVFSQNIKIRIAVESSRANHLRSIIGQKGAGRIGNYSYCSFSSPVSMKRPFREIKKKGEIVETVAPMNLLADIVHALAIDEECKETGIDTHLLLQIVC